MSYFIKSLNTGKPGRLPYQEKELWTGFVKKPKTGPVLLNENGFTGDGQGDLQNHGGAEKAVLVYPYAHYDFWEEHYSRSFQLPSFGENITVTGLTEKDTSIGDTFQMGEAIIQICQPRSPCYKIAAFHQLKDIPSMVTKTGYSGFYGRVLKEGKVAPGEEMVLLEKGEEELIISDIFDALFHSGSSIELAEKVLESDYAASSLKKQFLKKMEGAKS